MIHDVTGNLFDTPADVRINTVNCVGVMGKGVALAFKRRYPKMYADYRVACLAGRVQPGRLHVFETPNGTIVNLPTKRHWRDLSLYADIEIGLRALRTYLLRVEAKRVTIPALGCGHGGLDWGLVRPMIEERLGDLSAEIFLFSPGDSRNFR